MVRDRTVLAMLVICTVCLWFSTFVAGVRSGYNAGVRDSTVYTAEQLECALAEGKAQAEKELFDLGRQQGRLDQLAIYEKEGPEAMKVQLKVVRGER